MYCHRTAFYDRDEGEIHEPAKGFYVVGPTGDVVTADRQGDFRDVDHLIPLASTGLEDSEGNEIFEGHYINQGMCGYNFYGFVIYNNKKGSFCVKSKESGISGINVNKYEIEIIGHALTDPDLVPDDFDVYDYFEITHEDLGAPDMNGHGKGGGGSDA